MEQFESIEVADAIALLNKGAARIVDIRDPQSYALGHPKGAMHLSDGTINTLLSETEFDTPIVVCCYHGISSQGAAQYLIQQGFEEVYSLSGGFEAWQRSNGPTDIDIEVS